MYIKGKYCCPFSLFIWFITMLFIVSYIVSIDTDHLLDRRVELLFVNICIDIVNNPAINKYIDIFVSEIVVLFKNEIVRLIRSLISN